MSFYVTQGGYFTTVPAVRTPLYTRHPGYPAHPNPVPGAVTTLSADGRLLTVTVPEMPANSSVFLEMVMTRTGVAEDGTPLDVHIAGWVHGTLADCPVYPVEPSRTPSMCVDGESVLPTITVPATENITYGEPVYHGVNEHGRIVSLTATANDGFVFPQPADGGVIAPGWHWIDEKTAEYRSTLAVVYCEPAVVELPVIEPSMCTNGAVTAPVFTAPTDSASVTYSEPVATETEAGVTYTMTATVNEGYTLNDVSLPADWTQTSPTTAEYSRTELLATCEVAELQIPVTTPAMCGDDDEDTTPVNPTLTAPANSANITYGTVTFEDSATARTFTLTATANDGYTFTGATMPEGWTMVSPTEATYTVTLDLPVCEIATPQPTVEPTAEPTSEPTAAPTKTPADPTKAADAPVTKLPSTGTGAGNGTSMLITGALGVMAIAMLAIGVIRSQKQRS